MKRLLMIGGAMGIGKTTVCQILKKELPNSVFLDGDWCWDSSPFQVTEDTKRMVLDNICYLLGNFISCPAYENIIFCWVMHEQSIIDAILGKLDVTQCVVKNISLVADEATLKCRLMADVAAGIRKPDVIERSVARLSLYGGLNTLKIDTVGKTAQTVADEIREAM